MIVFTIKDQLFKTEPLFVLGCSYAQLVVYLRRHYRVEAAPAEGLAGRLLTFSRSPWRVIWVKDATRRNAPVLLHEIFHLVTRICADKGIPIVAHHPSGESGDETAAYLLEFFAHAALRHLRSSQ